MYAKTESQRYYYTSQRSFEQSLDVYKPVAVDDDETTAEKRNNASPSDLPLIVVLVVGSAWVGHRSFIYTLTSWWNSSGPQAFTRAGCVTVCIRHRGSFPRVASNSQPLAVVMCVVLGAVAIMRIHGEQLLSFMFGSSFGQAVAHLTTDPTTTTATIAPILMVLAGWFFLALNSRGAANFDDMLHDVADALQWVQNHKDTDILAMPKGTSCGDDEYQQEQELQAMPTRDRQSQQQSQKQGNNKLLVFGGYSSGGHVAATVLQRPHLFASRGLPLPEELCDAALFISGVLAVRPPPKQQQQQQSRWLTDLVTHVVFGKHGATQLPSPLYNIRDKHPRIPHLLIGCAAEVFGLPWLDVFFCSDQFCTSLQQLQVPARCVTVDSDHWNILASQSLRSVIPSQLEWVMTVAENKKKRQE